jgi:hypothetical protein
MRIAIIPKWFWRFYIPRHILAREPRDLASRTQGDDCMDRTGFTHVILNSRAPTTFAGKAKREPGTVMAVH